MNPQIRPIYWSVRREIWENRSIYIAPIIVTAVVIAGSLISLGFMPARLRGLDPAKHGSTLMMPFHMAPAPIMMATFFVALFYCLDALYGERRERGILFWKSLPVSDRTTVIAKMLIPMVVLPSIAIILSIITQYILLFGGTAALVTGGMSPARLWSAFDFIQEPINMIYGMSVHVLWFAPIYGLLLLISAWARRAPVLWLIVPIFTIGVFERILFNSSHFAGFLQHRITGAMRLAWGETTNSAGKVVADLQRFDPLKFLSTPGLWLGLLFAAGCVLLAARLRRSRPV